jgi:hypothetical protein
MSRGNGIVQKRYLPKKTEAPQGATLAQLMDALSQDYSKHLRPLGRDIEALEKLYPVFTDRIDRQTRCHSTDSCQNSYKRHFSPGELMAPIFSRDWLKPLEGTEIQLSLDAAFNKAAAILPPEGMAHVWKAKLELLNDSIQI